MYLLPLSIAIHKQDCFLKLWCKIGMWLFAMILLSFLGEDLGRLVVMVWFCGIWMGHYCLRLQFSLHGDLFSRFFLMVLILTPFWKLMVALSRKNVVLILDNALGHLATPILTKLKITIILFQPTYTTTRLLSAHGCRNYFCLQVLIP